MNDQTIEFNKFPNGSYIPNFCSLDINVLEGHGGLNLGRLNLFLGGQIHTAVSFFSGSKILAITSFTKGSNANPCNSLLGDLDKEYLLAGNAILNSINGGYGINDLKADEINNKLKSFDFDSKSFTSETFQSSVYKEDMRDIIDSSNATTLEAFNFAWDTNTYPSSSNTALENLIGKIGSAMSTGTYDIKVIKKSPIISSNVNEILDTLFSSRNFEVKIKGAEELDQVKTEAVKGEVKNLLEKMVKTPNLNLKAEVRSINSLTDDQKSILERDLSDYQNQKDLNTNSSNEIKSVQVKQILSSEVIENEKRGLAIAWLLGKALSSEERLKLINLRRVSVGIMPEFQFSISTLDFSIRRFAFDKAELSISSPLFSRLVTIMNDHLHFNFNRGCVFANLSEQSTKSRLVDHFHEKKTVSVNKKIDTEAKPVMISPSLKAQSSPKTYSYDTMGSGIYAYFTNNFRISAKLITSSSKYRIKGIKISTLNKGGKYSFAFGPVMDRFNFNKLISSY
jgi:hypothetical protein